MRVSISEQLSVEEAIKEVICGLPKEEVTIDSDPIIARSFNLSSYIPDHGIPASKSRNAHKGKIVRLVGEDSGLIEKISSVSKKIDGSRTTVTRYKIIKSKLDKFNDEEIKNNKKSFD